VTRGLLAGGLVVEARVARTHLAITVELVHGVHTGDLWPRPGRVLIAARTATFEQLGKAIDDAFARWDHNHLHEFTLADGTVIIPVRWWDGEEPERSLDDAKARLRRLRPGEQFAYTFDLGDNWQHLCTVAPERTSLSLVREAESHATPAGLKATPMSSGPEGSLVMKEGAPCGRSNRRRPARPGPGHAGAPLWTAIGMGSSANSVITVSDWPGRPAGGTGAAASAGNVAI
jgi:hypothetical protein